MNTVVQEHLAAPPAAPPRRRRLRGWIAAVFAVLLLAGGTTWFLTARHRALAVAEANVLDPSGSTSGIFWADPRDEAAVRVTADDFTEYSRTVPLRKGESMTLVLIVTNESAYPVTVRGSTEPDRLVVTAATDPGDVGGGAGAWEQRTFGQDVVIAPGRWHYLRAEYTAALTCQGFGKGVGISLGDFSVDTLVDGTPRVVQVHTSPIIRAVSPSDDEPASCASER